MGGGDGGGWGKRVEKQGLGSMHREDIDGVEGRGLRGQGWGYRKRLGGAEAGRKLRDLAHCPPFFPNPPSIPALIPSTPFN